MSGEPLHPYPKFVENYNREAFDDFAQTLQSWAKLPWAWGNNSIRQARADWLSDYSNSQAYQSIVIANGLTKEQLLKDHDYVGALGTLQKIYDEVNSKYEHNDLKIAQVHILRLMGDIFLTRVSNTVQPEGHPSEFIITDLINAGLAYMKADEIMGNVTLIGRDTLDHITRIDGFRDLSIFIATIGQVENA